MSVHGKGNGTALTTIEPPDPQDWARLVRSLQALEEAERRGELGDNDLPAGLAGAWRQLDQVIRFLMKQEALVSDGHLAPLNRLLCALIDLSNGITHSMFKPLRAGRNGNPGMGTGRAVVKGTAARAMTLLMRAGLSASDASRDVAAVLQPAARRELGPVSPKTVEKWREHLEAGEGPGAPAKALFAYRRELPPEFGNTPRVQADSLLDQLRLYAAGLS